MVAECVFPPIPSEAVLPLAGFSVSQGTLEFVGVLLVATAGSLVGGVLRITDADIDKAERWFARWGDWVVLGARVVPLARSIVSIPAGLAQMGLVRFSLLTALGSLVWNAALISAGWALEDNWRRVADLVGTAGLVVLVVLVVAVVAVAWWWWRRRARPRPGASSR